MKKILTLLTLCFTLVVFNATAQYNVLRIIVLPPKDTSCDKKLQAEFKTENDSLKKMISQGMTEDLSRGSLGVITGDNQENLLEDMILNEGKLNLYNFGAFGTTYFVADYLLGDNGTPIVHFMDAGCGSSKAALKKIAQQQNADIIINYPSLAITKKNGLAEAAMRMQVYDRMNDSIVMDITCHTKGAPPKSGSGISKSGGGILNGAVANAISDAFDPMMDTLSRSLWLRCPTLVAMQKVNDKRKNILLTNYYNKAYDKNFLKDVFKNSDDEVNAEDVYQLMTNDSNKFVGFFMHDMVNVDYQVKKDYINDSAAAEASSKPDSTVSHEYYVYTVAGVKYKGKWHYQIGNKYPVLPDSIPLAKQNEFCKLIEKNFFKKMSTELNPDFWNMNWFGKVKLPNDTTALSTNAPKFWAKWKREKMPYVGTYYLINYEEARRKIEGNVASRSLYESKFAGLSRFMADKNKGDTIFAPIAAFGFSPEDRSILIVPAIQGLPSGKRVLHYYAVFGNDSTTYYEWTYLPAAVDDDTNSSDGAIALFKPLSNLLKSDITSGTIDDKNFWDTYVFQKENGEYKYLRKVSSKQ